MNLRGKTGIHNRQILIRKRKIDYYIWFYFIDKIDELVHIISINLSRSYFRLAAAEFFLQSVAFAFCTAGNADFLKNITILTAFVNCNAGYTTAADN